MGRDRVRGGLRPDGCRGKSEPTAHDVSAARWLGKLFEVMEMPLEALPIGGEKWMVSLRGADKPVSTRPFSSPYADDVILRLL